MRLVCGKLCGNRGRRLGCVQSQHASPKTNDNSRAWEEMIMISAVQSGKLDRRTVMKAAAAAGMAQFAAPFAITARAADEVKFGLNDPLTGTYAELGKNERIGCQSANQQINSKVRIR